MGERKRESFGCAGVGSGRSESMDGDGGRIGDGAGVGRGGALDDHAVGADLYLASLRGEG